MNEHIDPDVFEQRFERAIREPSSMPRPYHDWDNPANWEQFTGNTKKFRTAKLCWFLEAAQWQLMHSANT